MCFKLGRKDQNKISKNKKEKYPIEKKGESRTHNSGNVNVKNSTTVKNDERRGKIFCIDIFNSFS